MTQQAYTVTIVTRQGETFTEVFDNQRQALAFCKNEVKWESTARVQCQALGFDQQGDFV